MIYKKAGKMCLWKNEKIFEINAIQAVFVRCSVQRLSFHQTYITTSRCALFHPAVSSLPLLSYAKRCSFKTALTNITFSQPLRITQTPTGDKAVIEKNYEQGATTPSSIKDKLGKALGKS